MQQDLVIKTKQLVDDLKAICANHGLGNDGNEYKIITEVFLYKFLNDKFFYEFRKLDKKFVKVEKIEEAIKNLSDKEFEFLSLSLPASVAKIKKEQFLSNLFNNQGIPQISKYFDDTLKAVASDNADIFAVATSGGEKIKLFNGISNYIVEEGKRDGFCKAIINKLVNFNFENVFTEKFDFFSTIFEYLIKDYNKDGGGKYAEYYTPHAVAKIMAQIMVEGNVKNATCYDPSAGTGSLLMSLAHQIGEDRCTIYSQDISQKSSTLLRFNLIINGLVDSIPNVVQGNTLTEPYHLKKGVFFDYIVSNPPFKLDFSDERDKLDINKAEVKEGEEESLITRFFAGVPSIPQKDKDKMAIYLLFIQHIIKSLSVKGKAAVVVPTGFLTEGKGKATNIANKIRMHLVDKKMLKAIVSMPSNIFANTGTNVSIIFIDKANKSGKVALIDASNLGVKVKEDKNLKTVLSTEEENKIIETVKLLAEIDDFSVAKTFDEIKKNGYSFNPGSYFDVKIEYSDLTPEEFADKMKESKNILAKLFEESVELKKQILANFEDLKYGE